MDKVLFLLELKKHYESKVQEINNFYMATCSLLIGITNLVKGLLEKNLPQTPGVELITLLGLAININWVLTINNNKAIIKNIDNRLAELPIDKEEHFFAKVQIKHKFEGVANKELFMPTIFIFYLMYSLLRSWVYGAY